MGTQLPVTYERRSDPGRMSGCVLPAVISRYGPAAETAWHGFFSGHLPFILDKTFKGEH